MKIRMWIALAALVYAFSGCAQSNEAPVQVQNPGGGNTTTQTKVKSGHWGGSGINVDVTSSGASGFFGCSRGEIAGPLALDENGHFSNSGTIHYFSGAPGPAVDFPATFNGSVTGDRMDMTVSYSLEGHTSTENYHLDYGVQGDPVFCAE